MRYPKIAIRLLAGGSIALMAACATAPPAPEPGSPRPPPKTAEPGEPVADRDLGSLPEDVFAGEAPEDIADTRGDGLDINRPTDRVEDYLPYIDVAIEPKVLAAGKGPALQDRYTRIQIVTLDPDAYNTEAVAGSGRKTKQDTRNYDRESRGWLQRTMMGSRNVTRTLMADFDISNPDIKTTKALFSATFQSDNAKGEAWATNESISVYATPYFRVSPNTTIEGRFRMQLSDERQASAGANVMNALQTAANLIAPTSALVTFFNAPAMLQASTFLNTQSAALFGQSISEESTGAFAIKSWTDDPILMIRAELPPPGNIRNTAKKEVVGKWAVYLEPPIPSVFTTSLQPGQRNEPSYAGVSSADILTFNVGTDLRVYDYIFSRLELKDRLTSLNASGDPETARLICTRISRGLSEIGFTTFDAAAGVWAASESDQLSARGRTALQNPESCESMKLWKSLAQ